MAMATVTGTTRSSGAGFGAPTTAPPPGGRYIPPRRGYSTMGGKPAGGGPTGTPLPTAQPPAPTGGGTYVPTQRPAPSMGGYQAALQANRGFVPTAVSNPGFRDNSFAQTGGALDATTGPAAPLQMPREFGYQGQQAAAPQGGYTPQPYQPYQPEPQAPAPRYPSGTPRAERDAVKAERQRVLLGAAAKYLPLGGDVPITRGEVGSLQTAENYRAQEQADEDLRRGVDELIRGRGAVGSSPEEQMALEIAMRRAQEGGQFNDEYLDQQRGAIRNRSATGLQSAERRMLESLAQRGLSDSPTMASDIASLQQQNAVSTQGQLADFEQQAATAREEAERAALGQLTGLSESRSGRRQELDELLAGAYLQNERAPVDLSPLMTKPKKPREAVGGRPPREPKKKKKKSEE